MYKINRIGPWPIIDPSQSKIVDVSTALTETDVGSDLKVWLDTANLGTKSDSFANNLMGGTTAFTAALKLISFGVALQPIQNVNQTGEPTFLDINIKAYTGEDQVNGKGTTLIPWVGFIKTAGASIANGFAAANLVEDYCIIPSDNGTYTLDVNTQVLLQNINSGSLDLDKFVCVGFSAISKAAATFNYFDYTISAAYATKAISTAWKGAY